jgi:hypothetical protein
MSEQAKITHMGVGEDTSPPIATTAGQRKFTQLVSSRGVLWALDSDGQVWQWSSFSARWLRLERDPWRRD